MGVHDAGAPEKMGADNAGIVTERTHSIVRERTLSIVRERTLLIVRERIHSMAQERTHSIVRETGAPEQVGVDNTGVVDVAGCLQAILLGLSCLCQGT